MSGLHEARSLSFTFDPQHDSLVTDFYDDNGYATRGWEDGVAAFLAAGSGLGLYGLLVHVNVSVSYLIRRDSSILEFLSLLIQKDL